MMNRIIRSSEYKGLNYVLRFKRGVSYLDINLRRIMKRLIHPHIGEAWLELRNSKRSDPHVHGLSLVPSSSLQPIRTAYSDRLEVISEGTLYLSYMSELKSWSQCRQYNADQSLYYDKDTKNQYIYANYDISIK